MPTFFLLFPFPPPPGCATRVPLFRPRRCDEITATINELETGVAAAALHGDRSQSERECALRGFKQQTTPLLIATDVAARGLDVQGVAHVINLDLPRSAAGRE